MLVTTKVKPLLRGHFHQAMFFAALGAFTPLILRSRESQHLISLLIYAACAIIMFGISTLYHRVTWTPKRRALWKKFDHCGIYLMIAGTCTPVASIGLSPESSKILLTTIWLVAFAGIIQSIFFTNIPKYVSSILYLITGYLVVPYFSELHASIGMENSSLIIAGGVVYSIGAITYALKKPIFKPHIFGYHEFFHILINIGAIIHFLVINDLVK